MKPATAVFALWFVLAGVEAGAGAVNTNASAPSTIPQRSMLTMGGIVTTPERKASPRFNGSNLPAPSMQHSR
jgi:hypothetical protein